MLIALTSLTYNGKYDSYFVVGAIIKSAKLCICIRYGSIEPSTPWRYLNMEIKWRKKKYQTFVLKKIILMKWNQMNCVFNLLFLCTITRFFFIFVLICGHVATTVFIICKVRAILLLNTQKSIPKNKLTGIIKTL